MSWAITAAYFVPGAVAGGAIGWLIIRPVNAVLGWLFRGFNRLFDRMTAVYGRMVGGVLRVSAIVLVLYAGLLVLTYWQFNHAPTGFVPQQDKGYLLLNVQLPDSASVERTQRVMARIEALARNTPGVEHTVGVSGQSLLLNANAPNLGSMYIMLKEFSHRRGPKLTADAIAAELKERCQREVRGAIVSAFGAPPIDGLGTTGGFKLIIEDRGNLGLEYLQRVSDQIVERGNETPGLQGLFNSSRANTPWLYLEIDRTKCVALGVPVSELFNTLQVYLGSYYVNNFNEFGRSWQVNIQADQRFRGDAERHRAASGAEQPGADDPAGHAARREQHQRAGDGDALQHVLRHRHHRQPGAGDQLRRGDCAHAGDCPPGIAAVDGFRLDRAGVHADSGRATPRPVVFVLAVVFVFLVLAAQYESWKLPLAVILVMPMCLLCSLVGVTPGRHGRESLHPDRLRGAGRPGQQERDPDRRVRQAEPGGRRAPSRSHAGRHAGCGCGRS